MTGARQYLQMPARSMSSGAPQFGQRDAIVPPSVLVVALAERWKHQSSVHWVKFLLPRRTLLLVMSTSESEQPARNRNMMVSKAPSVVAPTMVALAMARFSSTLRLLFERYESI